MGDIPAEWRSIADRIEALLPHLAYADRFAPAMVVEAYRAKADRMEKDGG